MLMPSKVKYRKQQRGRMRGKALRGGTLSFGEFGLQALEPGWLSSRQIEASRITITRHMKRKGKGDPEFWVDVIRPGKILFELEGIGVDEAREAMRLASHKLPIKTRFISRELRELR